MNHRRWLLMAVIAVVSAASVPIVAQAQSYPSKPIRFLIGFPPGGSAELPSRIVAAEMSAQMGQPIIVETRPGVSGWIAHDAVLKSAPDGYTIGFLAAPTVINSALNNREWDAGVPLGTIFNGGFFIGLNPGVPGLERVRTFADLVAYAKAARGRLNVASIGVGSQGHLSSEMVRGAAGAEWTHVAYKGEAPANQALLSGEVPVFFGFTQVSTFAEQIKADKIRLIAAVSSKRLPSQPDVPTLMESGYQISVDSWGGITTPHGMPAAVQERLQNELRITMSKPAILERLRQWMPEYMSPTQYAALIKNSYEQYSRVIKVNNIKPE